MWTTGGCVVPRRCMQHTLGGEMAHIDGAWSQGGGTGLAPGDCASSPEAAAPPASTSVLCYMVPLLQLLQNTIVRSVY